MIGEEEKVRKRWTEYFCEVLVEDMEEVEKEIIREVEDQVGVPTQEELRQIIMKLKNNKRQGKNGRI